MLKQRLGILLLVIAGCGSEPQPQTSNAEIGNGAKSNGVMDAAVEEVRPEKSLSAATKADVSVVLETERAMVARALPLDGEVPDLGVFAAPLFNKKANHAAAELASYLQRLLQRDVPVVRSLKPPRPLPRCLFVVGSATDNSLAADLEDRGLVSFDRILPAHSEGFIIRSVRDERMTYILLAGRTPLATLYAVYHYLETYCGVGYFEDGEYVPRSPHVPIEDLDVTEWPRFEIRLQNPFTTWIRDLKRCRGTFWTTFEWKSYFDFLVKNKQNWSRYEVCDMQGIGYGWFLATYPEIGQAPDTGVLTAWWPPEYVLQTTRQSLDYGRRLGLKFMYTPVVQYLPEYARDAIAKKFPDAVIRDPDPAYRMTTYIIDTPGIEAYLENNIQSMLKHYGAPDAMSSQFPVFETEGAAEFGTKWDPKLFNMGSRRILKHMPETRSFIDGWGLAMRYKNPEEWQTQLVTGMEHPVVWTSQYPWLQPDPYHEQLDYFRGQPWMYWEIDSFGGRDYLHSFIPYQKVIKIAQDILSNPLSNCIGYGTQPEMIGYDPFVRYLYMKLAWDPTRYADIKSLVSEYVARRYSATSYETMLKSHTLLVECLSRSIPGTSPPYSGSDGAIYREARQINYSAVAAGWPLYTRMRDLQQLREALLLALRCQENENDNQLYANDVGRLFQSYAAKLFAFSTVRCYSAYAQLTSGYQQEENEEQLRVHRQQFDTNAMAMTRILELLEAVWQTQPELSMDQMINQVTSVPGTSPAVTSTIRGHCAGFFNECYEVMRDFYRPQLGIILDDLRERLDRRDPALISVEFGGAKNWEDNPDLQWVEPPLCAYEAQLYPKLARLHAELVGGTYQPRTEIRRGDTVAAVLTAVEQFARMELVPAAFQDMATEASIRTNYPLPRDKGPQRPRGYGGVVTTRASAEAFDQGERLVLGKDAGFQGTYMEASKVQVDFDLEEIRRIAKARICLDLNAYNAGSGVLQREVSVIVNGKKHLFIKAQTPQTSLLGNAKICDWDGLSCFEVPRNYLQVGRNTIRLESGDSAASGDDVFVATDHQGNPVVRLVLELEQQEE